MSRIDSFPGRRRPLTAPTLAVVAALAIGGCDTVRGVLPGGGAEATAGGAPIVPEDDFTEGPRIAYEVAVTGVDGALRDSLQEQSRLLALADEPPATVLGLRRRAAEDADRLVRVLRSLGHYAAAIEAEVDADREPARVTLAVEPGPVYTLGSFEIVHVGPQAPSPTAEDLDLTLGDPALAETVLGAVTRVPLFLRQRGHPFAEVVRHTARVDHAARTMAVEVETDAGAFARFGPATIAGLEDVREDYVRVYLAWQEGLPYDITEVQEVRRAILATGLFETVDIRPAEEVAPDGSVPMRITVSEASHRSIGAGARYSSSLGLGGTVFWEHRNLFGRDETVRPFLEVAERSRRLGSTFEKPGFLGRRGQILRATIESAEEEFDAYDRLGVMGEVSLERRLSPTWTGSVGTSLEYGRLDDMTEGSQRSALWGVPLRLWRDATDDRLDPRSGSRLDFSTTPFWGTYGGPVLFTSHTVGARVYQAVDEDRRVVLAGRILAGTLLGAARQDVPIDRRFYSGGGGSVRGYGYQRATNLDARGEPMGGRSVFEVGFEVRWQVTDTIGIVPFVDGGRAFTNQVPDLSQPLFWGVGLGGRYFSPVGPIRLDVAIPLDRRRNIDDPYQVYISLGQAF